MSPLDDFSPQPAGRRRLLADGALLLVSLLWGSTFVIVKQAVAEFPTMTFLALRFALAALCLAAVFWRDVRANWRRLAVPGLVVGACLWGGYTFQTFGLRLTQASRAGFITGLSVVLVPVLSSALFRQRTSRQAVGGTALALLGMGLLFLAPAPGGTGTSGEGVVLPPTTTGDLLVLACALFFALHIVTLGRFSAAGARSFGGTGALATLQVAAAAVGYAAVCLASYLLTGTDAVLPPAPLSRLPTGAIILTGLLGTAAAFLVQTTAQRYTPPTHTALILATEPVFAALFGWLVLEERLGLWAQLGCLLILGGMVVAEFPAAAARTTSGRQEEADGSVGPSRPESRDASPGAP